MSEEYSRGRFKGVFSFSNSGDGVVQWAWPPPDNSSGRESKVSSSVVMARQKSLILPAPHSENTSSTAGKLILLNDSGAKKEEIQVTPDEILR